MSRYLPAIVVSFLGAAFAALLLAGSASAALPAPHLELEAVPKPSSFSPTDTPICEEGNGKVCDQFRLTVYSTGAAATHGQIVITDTLPAGLEVVPGKVELFRIAPASEEEILYQGGGLAHTACKETGRTITCRVSGALAPDQLLQLQLTFDTTPSAVPGAVNVASVSGGEAPPQTVETPILVGSPPPFGIASLFTGLTDQAGEPLTQAGAHPFKFTTRFRPTTAMRRSPESQLIPTSVEPLRDAVVDLPPGLIGSAVAAPRCSQYAFTTHAGCPAGSRVGFIRTEPDSIASINSWVYNMVPPPGTAAQFGFGDILGNLHVIDAKVVPGPQGYAIRATTPEIPEIALSNVVITFYGDPSARDGGEELPPMFSMPADCSGAPLTTRMHVDSWANPGPQSSEGPILTDPRWAFASAQSPAVSGCEELHFEPSLEAVPTTNRGDSPTGLDVTLTVPQTSGAEEAATPPLKKAVIALPAGMTVNPSSANGLEGCSLADLGVSANGQPDGAPPNCPTASKIGTVELEVPVLPGILQGVIYVAKQGDNPFHNLLTIYIVVDDPTTGVVVKLPGEIKADPTTGQLTTTVDNNPQLPFSVLRTHFFAGQRAALRTPSVCGRYAVTSSLTPWSAPQSGPPATPSSSFQISQGCASSTSNEPNQPAFTAGTLAPVAGAYSPFVLRVARQDGSQEIGGLNLTLPPGLLARVAGVPYCSDSALATVAGKSGREEIASPSCPAASEVGTVTVGAGAGLEPFYTTGRAYLAGPYKGAPLSLAIITPAVAGPFDLGDVLVRNALQVDPFTAQVTAVSDPIPHILQGIPLDVRSIDLGLKRPEFTLNPTNCERRAVTGTLQTILGGGSALSNPFQVLECRKLSFGPKLSLSLKGPTKRRGHPGLKAVLTYPSGGNYANIASARVGLPGTEFLDQSNLNNVCKQAQLASGTCPKSSIYGSAKAWSPLLEKPLEGNVYLAVGFGHKLPDLVAELNGQIRVLLHAKIDQDSEHGLRSNFEVVPDAPISRFVLTMKGGKKYGLLENTAGVCATPQKATVQFGAQNGLQLNYQQKIVNDCGKKSRSKGKKRHHSKRGANGGHGAGK